MITEICSGRGNSTFGFAILQCDKNDNTMLSGHILCSLIHLRYFAKIISVIIKEIYIRINSRLSIYYRRHCVIICFCISLIGIRLYISLIQFLYFFKHLSIAISSLCQLGL